MISGIITALRTSSAARIALALILLAGVLWALLHWVDRAQDMAVAQAEKTGAATQQATDQAAVINQVEKAKDAQEAIRVDTAAARAGCLRYSRTPENCQ